MTGSDDGWKMKKEPKWVWGGVCCQSERDRRAVHSWFSPPVPEEWGLPIAAQVQEHVDTGKEGASRTLYRTPSGGLKEVIRRRSSRGITFDFKPASPGFLEDRGVAFALRKAADLAEQEASQ